MKTYRISIVTTWILLPVPSLLSQIKIAPGFLYAHSITNPPPIMMPYNLPMQAITAMMPPYTMNISQLTASFGDANMLDNFGEKSGYLHIQQLDLGGQLAHAKNGISFAFTNLVTSPAPHPCQSYLLHNYLFLMFSSFYCVFSWQGCLSACWVGKVA